MNIVKQNLAGSVVYLSGIDDLAVAESVKVRDFHGEKKENQYTRQENSRASQKQGGIFEESLVFIYFFHKLTLIIAEKSLSRKRF